MELEGGIAIPIHTGIWRQGREKTYKLFVLLKYRTASITALGVPCLPFVVDHHRFARAWTAAPRPIWRASHALGVVPYTRIYQEP